MQAKPVICLILAHVQPVTTQNEPFSYYKQIKIY